MTLSAVPTESREKPVETRESFDEFVAVSRDMLAAAQCGHWETVMGLQGERQRRLEAYFANPVSPELADQVAAGIREMLELDRQIVDLGRKGMEELAGAMNGLRTGRRAQQAYGAVGA